MAEQWLSNRVVGAERASEERGGKVGKVGVIKVVGGSGGRN